MKLSLFGADDEGHKLEPILANLHPVRDIGYKIILHYCPFNSIF